MNSWLQAVSIRSWLQSNRFNESLLAALSLLASDEESSEERQ